MSARRKNRIRSELGSDHLEKRVMRAGTSVGGMSAPSNQNGSENDSSPVDLSGPPGQHPTLHASEVAHLRKQQRDIEKSEKKADHNAAKAEKKVGRRQVESDGFTESAPSPAAAIGVDTGTSDLNGLQSTGVASVRLNLDNSDVTSPAQSVRQETNSASPSREDPSSLEVRYTERESPTGQTGRPVASKDDSPGESQPSSESSHDTGSPKLVSLIAAETSADSGSTPAGDGNQVASGATRPSSISDTTNQTAEPSDIGSIRVVANDSGGEFGRQREAASEVKPQKPGSESLSVDAEAGRVPTSSEYHAPDSTSVADGDASAEATLNDDPIRSQDQGDADGLNLISSDAETPNLKDDSGTDGGTHSPPSDAGNDTSYSVAKNAQPLVSQAENQPLRAFRYLNRAQFIDNPEFSSIRSLSSAVHLESGTARQVASPTSAADPPNAWTVNSTRSLADSHSNQKTPTESVTNDHGDDQGFQDARESVEANSPASDVFDDNHEITMDPKANNMRAAVAWLGFAAGTTGGLHRLFKKRALSRIVTDRDRSSLEPCDDASEPL